MRTIFDTKIRVSYAGMETDDITLRRGVKQGRAGSMRFFVDTLSYHFSMLQAQWTHKGYGLRIGDKVWTHFGHADDFHILAVNLEHIRIMIGQFRDMLK
eukprot:12423504-Karenia_brevis.AAC.1